MCWIHQHLLWKRHIGKLEGPCILWVAAVCKNQACTCWVDSWTPFISHAQICFSFYGNMVSFRMVKIVHLHGNCKNGRLCYFYICLFTKLDINILLCFIILYHYLVPGASIKLKCFFFLVRNKFPSKCVNSCHCGLSVWTISFFSNYAGFKHQHCFSTIKVNV